MSRNVIREAPKSKWSMARQRFYRHRPATVSAIALLIIALLSLATPLFEAARGIDGTQVNLTARFHLPSAEVWLGRDELGRDVFQRLLKGGQISLIVGLVTAVCAAFIGTAIGLIAGYRGGWLDAVLMRSTDSIIALPLLPLLIVMAALDLNKLGLPATLIESENISLYRIIFIVALVGWTTVARLVRSAALSVRERDYVIAAKSLGASTFRIVTVHILPNLMSSIIVATTLSVGNIILLESVLSFLGLGIQPPIPSWGNLLSNAQGLVSTAPWLALYPGIAIIATVAAFNFLGDGLQNALDPKAH